MRTIGFITSSGSAHRGIGFYSKRLLTHLQYLAKDFNLNVVENATNCDILHYSSFDLFSHTLPIFSHKPRIVSILDVIPLEYPQVYRPGVMGRSNHLLQKIALKKIDQVITISYSSLKKIHTFLDVPHEKLNLTYLAADRVYRKINSHTQLKKIKDKFNLPDRFVLYVGGINYNKNLPNLFKACQLAKLPLVIVGKEVANLSSLDLNHSELMHLKGLDFSNVHLLGYVSTEDLVLIYNLASVYCQPSFSEGFGLSVLEALSSGTPVAISDIEAFSEIVGKNGFYFNPYSPEQISSALTEAIGKKPAPVNPKFSWENTAKQTLLVYSRLCQKISS